MRRQSAGHHNHLPPNLGDMGLPSRRPPFGMGFPMPALPPPPSLYYDGRGVDPFFLPPPRALPNPPFAPPLGREGGLRGLPPAPGYLVDGHVDRMNEERGLRTGYPPPRKTNTAPPGDAVFESLLSAQMRLEEQRQRTHPQPTDYPPPRERGWPATDGASPGPRGALSRQEYGRQHALSPASEGKAVRGQEVPVSEKTPTTRGAAPFRSPPVPSPGSKKKRKGAAPVKLKGKGKKAKTSQEKKRQNGLTSKAEAKASAKAVLEPLSDPEEGEIIELPPAAIEEGEEQERAEERQAKDTSTSAVRGGESKEELEEGEEAEDGEIVETPKAPPVAEGAVFRSELHQPKVEDIEEGEELEEGELPDEVLRAKPPPQSAHEIFLRDLLPQLMGERGGEEAEEEEEEDEPLRISGVPSISRPFPDGEDKIDIFNGEEEEEEEDEPLTVATVTALSIAAMRDPLAAVKGEEEREDGEITPTRDENLEPAGLDLEALRLQVLQTLAAAKKKKKRKKTRSPRPSVSPSDETRETETLAASEMAASPSTSVDLDIQALRSSVLESMKRKKSKAADTTATMKSDTEDKALSRQQDVPAPSSDPALGSRSVSADFASSIASASSKTLAQWFTSTFNAQVQSSRSSSEERLGKKGSASTIIVPPRPPTTLSIQTRRLVIDFSNDSDSIAKKAKASQGGNKDGTVDAKASMRDAIEEIKQKIAIMEKKKKKQLSETVGKVSPSAIPTPPKTPPRPIEASSTISVPSSSSTSVTDKPEDVSRLKQKELLLKAELKALRARLNSRQASCKGLEQAVAVSESALAGYRRLQAQTEKIFFSQRNLHGEMMRSFKDAERQHNVLRARLEELEAKLGTTLRGDPQQGSSSAAESANIVNADGVVEAAT